MGSPKEYPQILQQRLRYRGQKFDFEVNELLLPKGVEIVGEYIHYPGSALAIPITEEGNLILLRQYRYVVAQRLLEFPSGTIEEGEQPLETIQREIAEETGYQAYKWQHIGKFALAPSYSDEYINVFIARDLEKLEDPPAQDEDEDIQVIQISPEELEQAIYDGEAINAEAITSYFLARPFLEKKS
ncbi:MAG: NUDIX hydrolase [Prochloraceae cyanobacterium]